MEDFIFNFGFGVDIGNKIVLLVYFPPNLKGGVLGADLLVANSIDVVKRYIF